MDILLLAATGAIVGIIAGLLGIGGGILIVPVLALVFTGQGAAPEVIMQVAIGTSLATIVTTSLSSIRAHQKRGAIDWTIFKTITPGVVVGGVVGALIADRLPGDVLRIAFACFMVLIATQMTINKQPPPHRQLPGAQGMLVTGSIIGTVASLMGVGGGAMNVPFLTWCNVPVRNAIATSAAIGLPISLSGAVSFIVTGWGTANLPPWNIGYINLPAYLGIVIASTLLAPVGAALAHRLPPTILKRAFAVFLYVMAIKMFMG